MAQQVKNSASSLLWRGFDPWPWNFCMAKKKKNFVWFFRATPASYGGSQARGRIRAIAAGLHQSHSNVGSKPRL